MSEVDMVDVLQELEQVETFLATALESGSEEFNTLIRPLSEAGGKRLRASLCLLLGASGIELNGCKANITEEQYKQDRLAIAVAVEMLHLATLIHDDVLDQADLRRGTTTIHCTKGNKVAILSGDYLFAKAFALVAGVKSTSCLGIFTRIITALVEGEFLQMEDVNRLDQGLDRYYIKTQKKTADFIEGCMELGGLLGNWSPDNIEFLKRYGHSMGMGFQLSDDIMDYIATEKTTGKPVGKDLREGVLTYPLLSVVNSDNFDFVQTALADIQNDVKEPEKLISYVQAQNGIANAEVALQKYQAEAYEALAMLPDFSGKVLLQEMISQLNDRKV